MAIGTLRYAITNFIGSTTPIYYSSQDPRYVRQFLYNVRPSKPFRFVNEGVTGAVPEWVCVDLNAPCTPTICALFNHNLVLSAGGDQLDLITYDDTCSGGAVEHSLSMMPRRLANFNNLYQLFNWGAHQFWKIETIDANNAAAKIEFGEWFLGEWQTFTNARLQPGRADGPVFFEGTQTTYYGQIWSNYYAEAENFSIVIKSINNPAQVDELRLFLSAVKLAGGKFVFIPDDNFQFCYYVHMTNMADFGLQLAKGATCEHYQWTIELRTLVEGVALLG